MQLGSMRLSPLVIGLIYIAVSSWQLGQPQQRRTVNRSRAKGLPFSDRIIAGNILRLRDRREPMIRASWSPAA
jgi:hypothetical protein